MQGERGDCLVGLAWIDAGSMIKRVAYWRQLVGEGSMQLVAILLVSVSKHL